jgi:hypothetical protein
MKFEQLHLTGRADRLLLAILVQGIEYPFRTAEKCYGVSIS